jgi:hypothetical protein
MLATVDKQIKLSSERADRLSRLATAQEISEDYIVEKALDILFGLTELLDEHAERHAWSFIAEHSLQRIWDNEEDALYDNWREMYEVSTR